MSRGGRAVVGVERALGVAVGAHVFAVVLAQTRVFALLELAWRLRWLTLGVAAALAVALVLLVRPRIPRRLVSLGGAAAALVLLGLASAAWSPRPDFTVPRLGAFALVLVVGAGAAAVGSARPSTVRAVAFGLVGGALAVALAGLVVLAFDFDTAVEAATLQSGARYNGLGGNPNAAAVLLAVAFPLAVWLAATEPSPVRRGVAVAAAVLFAGSIVASGSRAAVAAAVAGSLVVVLARPDAARRWIGAGAIVVAFAVALAVMQIPQPAESIPPDAGAVAPDPRNAETRIPLADELGRPEAGEEYRRTLLSSGGRVAAVIGAAKLGLERPIAGFGFGTEDKVFSDRYYLFIAARPENSYVGTFLQLGIAGLIVVGALVWLLLAPVRSTRRTDLTAALVGCVVAGLVVALGQSFLLAAGSSSAATFWIGGFLAAATVDG